MALPEIDRVFAVVSFPYFAAHHRETLRNIFFIEATDRLVNRGRNVMQAPSPSQHMNTLSRVMVRAYCKNNHDASPEDLESLKCDLDYVAGLETKQWQEFVQLANTNHVIVRALTALENGATALGTNRVARLCEESLKGEQQRIHRAIDKLHSISSELQSKDIDVVVIKSLDHWPDLGSDVDLYTTSTHEQIDRVMRESFNAKPIERSWGDRLANKWNYRVPNLPELVEIHVQFLGQTGEHAAMAKRVVNRRVWKTVGERVFYVPAPEERIVISTLQRVYRHFYFRLCDMIDVAWLIANESIDFGELETAADEAGVWQGVATFLCLTQNYLRSYGADLSLPSHVVDTVRSDERVSFGNGFLRVSKITAASLYGSQLLRAGRRRDMRALARLPLLPPLAVSALVAHALTGNDKGIW